MGKLITMNNKKTSNECKITNLNYISDSIPNFNKVKPSINDKLNDCSETYRSNLNLSTY